MRTTLDLPEDLIQKAMEVTGAKTKTSLIIRSLEDVIRKSEIAGLKEYSGKLKLDIDLDELRDRH